MLGGGYPTETKFVGFGLKPGLACVPSVSVWFRSKEGPMKRTFGFDCAKKENESQKIYLCHFLRGL